VTPCRESGEALFTRGQAMIDVLNLFGFDAHAPGNWDFLYGPSASPNLHRSQRPGAARETGMRWPRIFTTPTSLTRTRCAASPMPAATGLKRVLPPYMIRRSATSRSAFSASLPRAPSRPSAPRYRRYRFTDALTEYPCYIDVLRNQEQVDLLVTISELEMARDIKLPKPMRASTSFSIPTCMSAPSSRS